MKVNLKKLRIAMARKCMTTSQLVSSTGMPRSTVNNVICGRSVRPSTLGRIALALEIDVKDIIEGE